MTVSINDLIVGPVQPANGVDTISLDFYLEDEDWIEVYKTGSETALVLTTDYTVSGVGTATGSITLTTAANGTDYYSVYLKVPAERSSDMQVRGGFRSGPFNTELDRLWQRIQYLDTAILRALRIGKTSNAPGPMVTETAAGRAGKFLAFSEDGADLSFTSAADAQLVTFPPSITDNAIIRANGTSGDAYQAGQAVEDDSGNWTIAAALTTGGNVNGRDMAADGTKLDYLTVTQAVDLDAIETRVNALDASVILMGAWDASAGTFPGGGAAQAGESWLVSVAGTVDGAAFSINDRIIAIVDNASTATYAANWIKADYSDVVSSVAGETGAISKAALLAALNVEDGADVTDSANVAAAGALMATGGETTGPIWQKHGTFHRVIVGTPNSGVYYSSGNQTGAIEIKFPTGIIQAWVMMTVDIGQLTTNAHSVLRISGYIWQAPGGTAWSGVSVTNETGDPVRDLAVRFGDDGTTHVIWIGELAAAWYHPTVVVRDVTFTDAYFDPAVDYANGWTVGLQATAFGTVGITDTENLPFAKGLSYGGSTKLVATTGGATLTGDLAATSVSFGSTALDAYEEGTFTPVYSDGTNNASAYTTQAGFYTLIGDICKFNIRIAPSNIGSVSGSLQIKGLPFAAKNTSNYYSGIAVHWANNLAITAGQVVTGYIQLNQSVIYMHLWDATTGTTALTSTEWPVNGTLILSGEYKIS